MGVGHKAIFQMKQFPIFRKKNMYDLFHFMQKACLAVWF